MKRLASNSVCVHEMDTKVKVVPKYAYQLPLFGDKARARSTTTFASGWALAFHHPSVKRLFNVSITPESISQCTFSRKARRIKRVHYVVQGGSGSLRDRESVPKVVCRPVVLTQAGIDWSLLFLSHAEAPSHRRVVIFMKLQLRNLEGATTVAANKRTRSEVRNKKCKNISNMLSEPRNCPTTKFIAVRRERTKTLITLYTSSRLHHNQF